jgi:hypothetical protein
MFEGRLVCDGGRVVLATELGALHVPAATRPALGPHHLVVRPSDVVVAPMGTPPAPSTNALVAVVRDVVYVGGERRYDLELADGTVITSRRAVDAADDYRPGDRVCAAWAIDRGAVVND